MMFLIPTASLAKPLSKNGVTDHIPLAMSWAAFVSLALCIYPFAVCLRQWLLNSDWPFDSRLQHDVCMSRCRPFLMPLGTEKLRHTESA